MVNKKHRKPQNDVVPKVAEASRIKISEILEQFRSSNDEVYTFESNLSNRERAQVHYACKKLGMTSKSAGRGRTRCVSVYKSMKKVDAVKGSECLFYLTFSEKTKMVLHDLFSCYPPEEGEIVTETSPESCEKSDKRRRRKDAIFCLPTLSNEEILKKVESLACERVGNLKKITEQRSKLPISSFMDVITSTVDSHQVVLISGETGCGKTTQVPQFLLDYMWGKGKACKIICTQPRRISATSVSERISFERGQNVGDDIGYKIRLESKGGRNSSIVLCTNGILLRVLISKGGGKSKMEVSDKTPKFDMSDITHIIVDEIHERDHYSDFMLAIIRDMLPTCPHLRLILMSATIDAERFSQYFGSCPIICVPGFTYPVKSLYLDDVLPILQSSENNHIDKNTSSIPTEDKSALDEAIDLAWSNDEFDSLLELVSSSGAPQVFNYQHSLTGLTALMVFAGKGRVADVIMLLSLGADCQLHAKDGTTALELAQQLGQQEVAEVIRKHLKSATLNSTDKLDLLSKYLGTSNPELIDVVLIEKLVRKICHDSKDGAILVFLPGWDDINRTREMLLANPSFKDATKYSILCLHSMIPSVEQKKVFKRPPPGCRKIILSTNIAETAITIDDVVYVIDSGRMKEKSYDPYNNVSTFQSSWVSKASARQREGRAGRCQPGICYHLFSRLWATSLPDFQIPEIKRMPIEGVCLQVKLLDPCCRIEDFLKKTLDPPVSEAIQNAVMVLQEIGALSLDEKLTVLGEKLGTLPVHPLTSKMLLFAIMMNCLDPALTLACASDCRDPFTLPMFPNEKKKASAAKFELASLYGGCSDQLAVIAAFECWQKAKARGQEASFCSQYFISSGTMKMISAMRKQLETELIRNGFILENVSTCSLNAHDPGILHAVLVAGLYPMVGKLQDNGKRSFVKTASGDKVRLHPQSINFKLSQKKTGHNSPLIMYDEVTRGDGGMIIRNCSVVAPLPLLILAREIAVAPGKDSDHTDDEVNEDGSDNDANEHESDEDGMDVDNKWGEQSEEKIMSSPDNSVTVIVDRWLYFGSTAIDIAQIYCLRERLAAAILFKVTHPKKVLPPVFGASMYALACILSYDGVSINGSNEPNKFVSGKERTGNQSKEFLRSLIGPVTVQSSASNHQDFWPPVFDESSGPVNQNDSSPSPNLVQTNPQQNRLPGQKPHHKQKPFLQQEPHQEQKHLQVKETEEEEKPSPRSKPSQRLKPSQQQKPLASQKTPQETHQDQKPTPEQKPASKGPSLNGYGLGMYGPYGPRGDSHKRQRGNRYR